MSDTTDAILAYAVDVNADVVIPAAVAWNRINFVSHDIATSSDSYTSKVIRPDASVQDVRRTGSVPSGNIVMELARDVELENLIAFALRGNWVTNVLKAGVAKTEIMVEETLMEGALPYYTRFRGIRMGGFNLDTSTDGGVDITFPVSGRSVEVGTAITGTSTIVNAGSAPVLAGVDFTAFALSGLTTVLDLSDIKINMSNNLRTDRKLGSTGARGVGYGKREAEIDVTAFFKDHDAYTQFKNDMVTGVSFRFVAPGATSGFQFDFGRARIVSFGKPIAGDGATVMVMLKMKATYSTVDATDFKITRLT